MRIAIEGCGHGTLDAIYASVKRACQARGWSGVDLLIIGGDFQATRNAADLSIMSVPAKYRAMGDFHAYYSGARRAPYLTVFVGGNHEAAAHLWDLFYGGWVAPQIYYWGAANVLRLGPLRLAGLSGIWKGFDYRRPHHERLPFSADDIKSFYHVREIDARRLLQVREPVDVGLSHDWPRGIERHGDQARLFRQKPLFRPDSEEGRLGSIAAEYIMDRLRPPYWFSAHLHCKFSAIRQYEAEAKAEAKAEAETETAAPPAETTEAAAVTAPAVDNPDEIDLDLEDEDASEGGVPTTKEETAAEPVKAEEPVTAAKETATSAPASGVAGVSSELLAQLPASFVRPTQPSQQHQHQQPGQPVPPSITNTTVRFLALDKCLPGRHYLQLCEIPSTVGTASSPASATRPYRLEYDPEWLAITRVFADEIVIGDPSRPTPPDRGEEHYRPLIDAERRWVEENIVAKGLLTIPDNFEVTAPVHTPLVPGQPDSFARDAGQPEEYTNPQTAAFCRLVGVPNLWDASAEERAERRQRGPPAVSERHYERRGGGGGGRGGYRGRGGRGRGRGRGRY